MIHLLTELIVRLLGGIWLIRKKINSSPKGSIRNVYLSLYYYYLKGHGCFISHNAKFSDQPCLPHGLTGIFISGGAIIGEKCVIFQHVTLGSNPLPDTKTLGSPVIGDNCYIGAGATIIGCITIGNNTRIGANCTVFSNIKDNCVVVSQPPRIIEKKNMINKYYRWSPNGPVYYEDGKWVQEADAEIIEKLKHKL